MIAVLHAQRLAVFAMQMMGSKHAKASAGNVQFHRALGLVDSELPLLAEDVVGGDCRLPE